MLIPYLVWGVYTLRLRFRHHEEIGTLLECSTLVSLLVFYICEIALLRFWLNKTPVICVFAILGLAVSGAALYGPMIVSQLSQLVVNMLMPAARSETHEPQYGPAEALERQGDFEAAINEYMVIERIFPKETTPALRIAGNLMKLGRAEEAAPWFERSLQSQESPEKSLQITNRLCDIYCRQLDREDDAVMVLEQYLEKFPDAEYSESVQKRLARLKEKADQTADECF